MSNEVLTAVPAVSLFMGYIVERREPIPFGPRAVFDSLEPLRGGPRTSRPWVGVGVGLSITCRRCVADPCQPGHRVGSGGVGDAWMGGLLALARAMLGQGRATTQEPFAQRHHPALAGARWASSISPRRSC